MSKPANTTLQSKPSSNTPLPTKSAWANGPPVKTVSAASPISRSHSPNGSTTPINTPTHSRKPSGLGPGTSAVPLKDGVSASRGIVGSGHRASPSLSFGSIESNPSATPAKPPTNGVNGQPPADASRPPSKAAATPPASMTLPTPLPTPAQLPKSLNSPVQTPPVSSTSSPTPSSVSASTATHSAPSALPAKKKLDPHKMFQVTPQASPAAVPPPSSINTPSAPAVASPQQRTSNLPPPAQHQHTPYYSQQSQHPHLRSQSQSAVPRSPQLARAFPNGNLTPGPNPAPLPSRVQPGPPIPPNGQGIAQIGSPRLGHQPPPLHQPPPSHHPSHQPPAGQPPQIPMHVQQQWGPYYFYNEYGQVPGAPYWPQHHYPSHLPPPQHPQHPQHSGPIPISPRVPPMSNLPPAAAPPINTSISTPPPTNSRIPSTPLTAQAREFVPGQMGQMAQKKPAAIRITNAQGDPVVLKPDTKQEKEDVGLAKQENRKSKSVVRLESEEDRKRRLDEAKAKERAQEEERQRLKAEAEAKVRQQREREEEEKRKAEEERIRLEKEAAEKARKLKEAEEAEQRRKEEELRLKREEEERHKREEEERIKREEEERIRLEEERKRREEEERLRLEEEERRKKEEEEERLRKLKEEEEERLRAEAEAERLRKEAEEKAKAEEEERVRKEQEEAAAKEEAKKRAAAAAAASPKPASLPAKPTLPPLVTNADGKPRRPVPGPLDLTSTNRGSISQPLPSALATARIIEDLDSVSYPEGIKTPDIELNMGAKGGKFKYDRDFLLQFMSVCKDKPDMLPPLDALGIEREDNASSGFPGSRSTSRRVMPPPSANRQPSSGISSFGKNPFASMGNFQTTSRVSGDDRFNPNRRESTGAQFASNAIRAIPIGRSSSSGGVGGINAVPPSPREANRTRSQRGRQRNESLKASTNTPFQPSTQGPSAMSQSMEPIAPLEASANRWVAASTSKASRAKVDEDTPELVERKVKSLLNKLTLEKFDSISTQIIEWANKSEKETDGRTLMQVIRLVFEKATDEATWSEMYAKLCRKMMEQISPQVKDEGIRNAEGQPITGGLLFRKYLLNRCQEDFERGWKAKETAVAAAATKAEDDKAIEVAAKASGGKDDEVALYSDEYYILLKVKRQGLGLVKFIGELFKLQMLTERIMHECIKKLLSNVENPEEEDIESLCRLLITVGQTLDTPKARGHMDIYFSRMNDLALNKSVTQRMQFMLLDVIDLRKRNWIPRTAAAAPQTIAQVHEAAAKEKAAAEKEAMSRIGREPMSRGGSRRGEHTRGEFQQSVDGWNVAGSGGPPRPVGKAGDLSHFGKINKSSVNTFGPSSVFSSKQRDGKGKDTPPGSLSRAASSSNMFSMLSSGDASLEPPSAPRTASSRPSSRKTSLDLTNSGVPDTPVRKKLNLLPRTIPTNSLEEESRTDSEGEGDAEGSTAAAALTDEQANAKIEQDVKEFFMLKDVSEAEKYFADLPDPHKPKLVEKLVSRAFDGKETDIKMVAELFSRVANKTCAALAFEQGFLPTIEFIEDISIDVPQAYPFMALLLKGSKLSQDAVEALGAKISVEGDPLVAPKDKLVKEYGKLA